MMASKRGNMFHQNEKQETAEIDFSMVNMAETESMFLGPNRLPLNGVVSDDSEAELEAPSILMTPYQQNASAGSQRRNKRKNFQPRNILYSEEEEEMMPLALSKMPSECQDQAGEETLEEEEESALDLSSSEPESKRFKQEEEEQEEEEHPTWVNPVENEAVEESPPGGPMDLSSKAAQVSPRPRGFQLLQQAFLGGQPPPDASDIREYAQNTVKELLEIYGLNGPEVAESITNNVPIANFSSGKILESMSIRGGIFRPHIQLSQLPPVQQEPLRQDQQQAESLLQQQGLQQQQQGLQQQLQSLQLHQQQQQAEALQRSPEPPTPPRTPHSPQQPPPLQRLMTSVSTATQRESPAYQQQPQQSPKTTQTNNFTAPRMVLPQNVVSILALATAMQERGVTAAVSTRVPSGPQPPQQPSMTSSGDMPQQPSQAQLLIGAQASGIAQVPVVRDAKVVTPLDYSRYVRRFASSLECGSHYCKELNYREHFHCLDCNSRVFVKKEEMIRHFKWHKKRDESLQHGFMRYSPSDDCSDRYPTCGHNRKQTHYHCIQGTCDKVYISTSDVQMHANYHRKDSAIIQEGFQRLRATEECRTPYCAFFGQRTTHFHCRRDYCQFTFKNKADMEKHKTYHIKDEQLARDGFKKFLKPDPCGFPNCRFSQVCNHIHCVRDGCSYVLHSSGQLLSHKRKHERKDSEIAYRKYKLAQQAVVNIAATNPTAIASSEQHTDMTPGTSLQILQQASSFAALTALHNGIGSSPTDSRSSPNMHSTPPQFKISSGTSPTFYDQSGMGGSDAGDDDLFRYIMACNMNQPCVQSSSCPLSGAEHYHCKEMGCDMSFRCRETAEGHARMHEAQERVSDFFQESSPHCQETCTRDKHYHCTWEGCTEIVAPSERLEHFRSHEISAQHNNSLELLFRRKRGRPPKNRVIEVWNDYASGSTSDSPQAIFTSFKLPKPTIVPGVATPTDIQQMPRSPVTSQPSETKPSSQMLEMHGFQAYNDACPDPLCTLAMRPLHYHCSRPRCFFATDSEDFLVAHARDFHDNIEILEGFLFFDRSVDCRLENCPSNKVNRHFHCVMPGCGYSFVRYSHMAIHQAKHKAESGAPLSPSSQPTDLSETSEKETAQTEVAMPKNNESQTEEMDSSTSKPTVVKASGTFYPLCGLSNSNTSPTPPSEVTIKVEPEVILSYESPMPEWMSLDKHEKYGPEVTCSRPFCKLKRKEHYHCNLCNQAFSELEKLRPHIAKHSPGTIPPVPVKSENNNNEDNNQHQSLPTSMGVLPLKLENQEMLPPPHFPGFSAAMAAAVANQQLAMITSQGIPFMPHSMPGLYTSPTGLMFAAPPGFGPHPSSIVNNNLLDSARASILTSDPNAESLFSRRSISPQRGDLSSDAKKARVQSSMRMLKDEPVPEGYLRYRFNEDCRYTHCGYREHQTHFHCMRQDCGYSFCDKTRFVQHTARHERLDTLMGGDFQQYRANVSCGRMDCSYTSTLGSVQNKASHFHCLKCDFVCTDTNKVVAHRRQHQKLDSIMAAGFEKFTPSQPCTTAETCAHSGKQTHYHCLSCQYAVLGLSQMTAHKYRHME